MSHLQHGVLQHEAPSTGGKQGAEAAFGRGGGDNFAGECGIETTGIFLNHDNNLLSGFGIRGHWMQGQEWEPDGAVSCSSKS